MTSWSSVGVAGRNERPSHWGRSEPCAFVSWGMGHSPPSRIRRQRQPDRPGEARPGAERITDGGGLVAAVHHAVGALLVPTGPVPVPVGGLHQCLEGGGGAILQQIAGPLPPEDVVCGISPGRALVVALPHEEFEEQGRLVEAPPLLAIPEDGPKELCDAMAPEEVLLIGGLLVAVPRGDHHPFDPELPHPAKECPDPLR